MAAAAPPQSLAKVTLASYAVMSSFKPQMEAQRRLGPSESSPPDSSSPPKSSSSQNFI